MRIAILASIVALAAASCGPSDPQAETTPPTDEAGQNKGALPVSEAPRPGADVEDLSVELPMLASEAQKGESGARRVLLEWGDALEKKDFARAYTQFRHPPFSEADYRSRFADYDEIEVEISDGRMEGAAGSVYFTAPTAISGTTKVESQYELSGDVVLRRVNDVPGATEEQLRWKIESADLTP